MTNVEQSEGTAGVGIYVIVSPGGIVGWDWLWIGLMLVADIASYTSGAGRKRIPGYEGY